MPDPTSKLSVVLERARHLGFLGPGPLRARDARAERFVEAFPNSAANLIDLGSGGGLPALPLLLAYPSVSGILVEVMERRAAFLHWALAELDLSARVSVVARRAELVAREPEFRASADVVTARGFGPPALTAEIGMALARPGGEVLISEPPEPRAWRPVRLGDALVVPQHREGVVRLNVKGQVPDEYPRGLRRMKQQPLAFVVVPPGSEGSLR